MGGCAQHKALLKQRSKVELLTQSHSEKCCGFGSTFLTTKQPALSAEMVSNKTNVIVDTGTDILSQWRLRLHKATPSAWLRT
jgi:Fe-S oxidoreductase